MEDVQRAKRLRAIIDAPRITREKIRKLNDDIKVSEIRLQLMKSEVTEQTRDLATQSIVTSKALRDLDALLATADQCPVCNDSLLDKPYITAPCMHKICLICYPRFPTNVCAECREPFTVKLTPISRQRVSNLYAIPLVVDDDDEDAYTTE